MLDSVAYDLLLRAGRQALALAMLVAGPAVLATLVVGFLVGLVQVATQIQDASVTFVPKLVAVALVLLVLGPLMGAQLVRFAQALFLAIATIR